MADIDKQLEQTRNSIADFFSRRQTAAGFAAPDKPFLLVLDEIGTLDQDDGKTARQIDEVISHLEREYGVKVKVVCQSRDPQEKTAQSDYWQDENSTLRKHAFDKDFWHIRSEEAATRQALDWMQKGEVLGVIKYQDNLPEQETPKGVETMLRSQYKDNALMHRLLDRVGVRTGLLQPTKDIKTGHDIARNPDESLKSTIGGKAYGLGKLMHFAEANPEFDIKVPEFSVLSTKYCLHELGLEDVEDREAGENLSGEWRDHVRGLAQDKKLRSVRSGAPRSMPGMMHTVLNVGMTSRDVFASHNAKDKAVFIDALSKYSVFVESYQKCLSACNPNKAEEMEYLAAELEDMAERARAGQPIERRELDELYQNEINGKIPDDSESQYIDATLAVQKSWMGQAAVAYRRTHDIPDAMGTAVIYQEMAEPVLAGSINSHNPTTGEKGIHGEFGEKDNVVSGKAGMMDISAFAEQHPEMFSKLNQQLEALNEANGRPVEVEVTLVRDSQSGELDWRFLQMRDSNLTYEARLHLLDKQLDKALHEKDDYEIYSALSGIDSINNRMTHTKMAQADAKPFAGGASISKQAVAGVVVTPPENLPFKEAFEQTRQKMKDLRAQGHMPILMINAENYQGYDTLVRDKEGAEAVVMVNGGNVSSHAAVAARSTGKGCVGDARDNNGQPLNHFRLNGKEITISEEGDIFAGKQQVVEIANEIIIKAQKIAQTHPSLDETDRASLPSLTSTEDYFVKYGKTLAAEVVEEKPKNDNERSDNLLEI